MIEAMRILVNGQAKEAAPEGKLGPFLRELGVEPGKVAVAVNSIVVPRAGLDEVKLAEGDRIEVIEAVGGG